jgi:hypothetical protein
LFAFASAGFAVSAGFAGVFTLVFGDVTGAGVDGAAVAGGLFVLVVFVVLVAPPSQAIPKAPKTKTVESAITFFISLNSPVFFKD